MQKTSKNYGKSPSLIGKSTIFMGHVQEQTVKLQEGK
jgi:hypothetical protein